MRTLKIMRVARMLLWKSGISFRKFKTQVLLYSLIDNSWNVRKTAKALGLSERGMRIQAAALERMLWNNEIEIKDFAQAHSGLIHNLKAKALMVSVHYRQKFINAEYQAVKKFLEINPSYVKNADFSKYFQKVTKQYRHSISIQTRSMKKAMKVCAETGIESTF